MTPADWAYVTKLLMILVVTIVSIYDIFIMVFVGRSATISDVVYECARNWPIIPFVIGAVIGHLFWR